MTIVFFCMRGVVIVSIGIVGLFICTTAHCRISFFFFQETFNQVSNIPRCLYSYIKQKPLSTTVTSTNLIIPPLLHTRFFSYTARILKGNNSSNFVVVYISKNLSHTTRYHTLYLKPSSSINSKRQSKQAGQTQCYNDDNNVYSRKHSIGIE